MSDTQNKVKCECKNCHDIYYLDPAAIYNPYCPACQKCDSLELVERRLEWEKHHDSKSSSQLDAYEFTRNREKEIRETAAQPGPKLALHPEQWKDFKAAGYDMSSFTLIEPVAQNWGDTIEIDRETAIASMLDAGTQTNYVNDPVNHPKHYNDHPSGVECITITRHMNFNIGNAIKYLWRSGKKDKDFEIQDLRKAIWYIKNEIERLEEDNG